MFVSASMLAERKSSVNDKAGCKPAQFAEDRELVHPKERFTLFTFDQGKQRNDENDKLDILNKNKLGI